MRCFFWILGDFQKGFMVSRFYDDNEPVGTMKRLLSIFAITFTALTVEAISTPGVSGIQKRDAQANQNQYSTSGPTQRPRNTISQRSGGAAAGARGAGQVQQRPVQPAPRQIQAAPARQQPQAPPPPTPQNSRTAAPSAAPNNGQTNVMDNNGYEARVTTLSQRAYDICYGQIKPNFATCSKSHEDAQNSCDSEKDSGLNNAMNLAQQMSAMASSSVAGACSKAGGLLASANAGLAAYRLRCNSSRNACINECNKVYLGMQECVRKTAKSFYNGDVNTESSDVILRAQDITKGSAQVYANPREFIKNCTAMEGKVREAEGAIGNFVNTMMTAKQCEEMTAAAIPDFCKSNPGAPGCKATSNDCSDPANASSQICICQSNPMDPSCGGGKQSSLKLGGNPQSGLNGFNGGSGGGFDGNFSADGASLDVGENSPASTEGEKGGGAGASFGGGGGGGAGGLAGEGEYASEEDPTMVNSGFYGAGGAGGGGAYGDAGGGMGGGAYSGNEDIYDGTRGGVPDLRQFLPNGSPNPNYAGSMAGMGGPDGITGPHTNIWLKINNRYKEKEDTLLKP